MEVIFCEDSQSPQTYLLIREAKIAIGTCPFQGKFIGAFKSGTSETDQLFSIIEGFAEGLESSEVPEEELAPIIKKFSEENEIEEISPQSPEGLILTKIFKDLSAARE